MVVRLMPDVEALCIEYVKGRTEVLSSPLAGRLSTRLPNSPTWPYATCTLVSGLELIPEHLDEAVVQWDVWGHLPAEPGAAANPQQVTNAIARLLRAVLLQMPQTPSARGAVSNVRTIRPLQYLPDPTSTPARPRYSFDTGITLHPLPL